jgi:cytochrome c oxidase accessory protein FixG
MDAAPWTFDKFARKSAKHLAWITVSLLTGISFSIWCVDAYDYWGKLLSASLPVVGWVTLLMFLLGTYLLAGFLREQTCFWLCPYARIQGVMTDSQTILPTYDSGRGEPRGKLRAAAAQGDCIDCFQCVQVCPTGVDIRQGQQLGCITCGLCIDACDVVMDKIGKPHGLIRYASLDELSGRAPKKMYQHPRAWVYISIILVALGGIAWGLTHLGAVALNVLHERQPLFVTMSDGSIQNKYEFKVLNKTNADFPLKIEIRSGAPGQTIIGADDLPVARHGRGSSFTVFVRASAESIRVDSSPIRFRVSNVNDPTVYAEYESQFFAPKR